MILIASIGKSCDWHEFVVRGRCGDQSSSTDTRQAGSEAIINCKSKLQTSGFVSSFAKVQNKFKPGRELYPTTLTRELYKFNLGPCEIYIKIYLYILKEI